MANTSFKSLAMVSTCGEPTVLVILIATWTSCWVVNSSFGRTAYCWGGVVVVVDVNVDESEVAVEKKQKERNIFTTNYSNFSQILCIRWKQKAKAKNANKAQKQKLQSRKKPLQLLKFK